MAMRLRSRQVIGNAGNPCATAGGAATLDMWQLRPLRRHVIASTDLNRRALHSACGSAESGGRFNPDQNARRPARSNGPTRDSGSLVAHRG